MTYSSKAIQNEIIAIFGAIITEKIITHVKNAPFFTVIADEIQDVTSTEQLSVVLRTQRSGEFSTEERFLAFKELHCEMTGEAIATTILTALKSLGLDCDYLHGQGHDGSGSMAGSVRGASSCITQQHPLAVYVYCFSHTLNLAIANSCTIPLVRNMIGSVSEVWKFLQFQHIVYLFVKQNPRDGYLKKEAVFLDR